MVSGFGGLLGFYIPIYAAHGADYADITALMTYPSMFMGVGCLLATPLALAVGRRPVYLGSLVVLIVGALLAAYAKDYNWHLGARMVLGLAAGQSEALVPMMIQVNKASALLYFLLTIKNRRSTSCMSEAPF
jgi:predicted MFS family arabinose efflux permease